jgi:GT2 family glycosyltransferase
LTPNFLLSLVVAGELDDRAGTVCGKLLSMSSSFVRAEPPIVDSTGIFLTPELRHLDRGSLLPDDGKYDRFEYVFGATGAAALYRRAMVTDISVGGEFFDSDFFAYREDADVSWRAQLLGWKCLYCPVAVAYHVRSVLPSNRKSLPAFINMHSVKNRWLLRIKNMTGDLYSRFWLPITVRDLIVIGACFTVELSSLSALVFVVKNWRRLFEKRRAIIACRRTSDDYMARWISKEPVGVAATKVEDLFARAFEEAKLLVR